MKNDKIYIKNTIGEDPVMVCRETCPHVLINLFNSNSRDHFDQILDQEFSSFEMFNFWVDYSESIFQDG